MIAAIAEAAKKAATSAAGRSGQRTRSRSTTGGGGGGMSFVVNRLIGFGAKRAAAAAEQSAQWNSGDKDASITLSNGDRDATGSGLVSVRGLLGRSTGKYYFELVGSTSAGNRWGGFGNSSALLSSYAGGSASSAGLTSVGNAVNTWTKAQAGTPSVGATDVMGYALDLTNGRAFVAINNTWQFSSDPTTDTNPWVTGITGTVYPMGTPGNGGWRINTKTAELTYSPPTGWSQWAAA